MGAFSELPEICFCIFDNACLIMASAFYLVKASSSSFRNPVPHALHFSGCISGELRIFSMQDSSVSLPHLGQQ